MPSEFKQNPTMLLSRVLATGFVWAIFLLLARRLEVRIVEIILLVLGLALTAVIWMSPAPKERK